MKTERTPHCLNRCCRWLSRWAHFDAFSTVGQVSRLLLPHYTDDWISQGNLTCRRWQLTDLRFVWPRKPAPTLPQALRHQLNYILEIQPHGLVKHKAGGRGRNYKLVQGSDFPTLRAWAGGVSRVLRTSSLGPRKRRKVIPVRCVARYTDFED